MYLKSVTSDTINYVTNNINIKLKEKLLFILNKMN
jgi:hypothetical protein